VEQVLFEMIQRGDIIRDLAASPEGTYRVLGIHRTEDEYEHGLLVSHGDWIFSVETSSGERKELRYQARSGYEGRRLYRIRSGGTRTSKLVSFTPRGQESYKVGWFAVDDSENHRLFVFGTTENLMSSMWDISHRGVIHWEDADGRIAGWGAGKRTFPRRRAAAIHVLAWLLNRKLVGATYDVTTLWVPNWYDQLLDIKW